MLLPEITDHPFPEVEGFRVRIIDAKNPDALVDPEFDNTLQFFPKRSPIRRFEFERIYVLVFFRRIFRVLNRSIRPPAKPLRTLPDIRMIGRALIGEIQCHVDPPAFRSRNKAAKIIESSELGVNGLVSPLLRTDRPRASGLARLGFARVVFPFAMRVSDRMNRGKIKNVEAHFSDLGNYDPLAILERPAGPRKHFVPRTEARANGVDGNPQLPVMRGPGSVGIPRGERGETLINVFDSKMPSCVLELPCVSPQGTLTSGL